MMKPMAAAMVATLALSACDYPTNVDEAREHLGRNQDERIIPIQLPLPEISVTLADQLGALSGIVDTTDLSFRVDPDTFAFALDSLLSLEPLDPAPVVQGHEIVVEDFSHEFNLAFPAVPITLPGLSQNLPLPPAAVSGADTLPLGLGTVFSTATFAIGSTLDVRLATDGAATVNGVRAELTDGSFTTIGAPSDPVDLGPNSAATLIIDLGGVAVPSDAHVRISFDSGSGDGTSDNLAVEVAFTNAEVTAATGVDVDYVTLTSFTETVALDFAGGDFSEATLAAGTLVVDTFVSGTLAFDLTSSPDLAGLQIGGTSPHDLVVSGTVGPPAGAATVDISNTVVMQVGFTDLEVESVTLNSVSVSIDTTVSIQTDNTLGNLSRVIIDSGTLQVDVTNRLNVSGDVILTLNGITNADGTVVVDTFTLQPSLNGGQETTTVIIDLADAVLEPAALQPQVTGTISGTDVIVTPEWAAEAVTVDPYLYVRPREVVLSGMPDMGVELDQRVAFAASDIDLGELADLLDKLTFNDVRFTVAVDNGTGLDVQVTDFRMTLLDAFGTPVTNGAGDTARVALSEDSTGIVSAPAKTATVIDADGAIFVNALLDRVAAGEDVELAASGTVGPASDSGTIALGDTISVIFEMNLGPDVTIDPTGISFDQVVHSAIELDSVASELMADLSEDLVSAAIEFEVVNAMPFGLTVSMAMAPTPADTIGFDPFAADPNIALLPFAIDPAQVDAEGRVTDPALSSPEVSVDPAALDLLGEGTLSMGLNALITGPEGNRARLQPADSLVLRPLLKIEIRVGGNGGSQ